MKRISLFIISICSATMLLAQINSQNYISTRTMLNSTGSSYMDQIQYYDGLGRSFMQLEKGTTGDRKNLVSLQEYDTFGREEKKWLPIVTTSDYISISSFKNGAPGNYGNDQRPYSQIMYETSPMNRITEQYGPGSAWYSEHSASTTYLTNNTQSPLNCINYSINSAGTLINGGNYATGQLYVTQTKDEDKNITYTFTDKQDRTVLVRQMKGNETHDTYYAYDELGNLCFVLQPMYQSNANLDFYAFQYKYDSRNRCIWKKLPGAQYIEYVYDAADRLTFSQDGNQRASGKWTFYEYDNLNRLTCQGECTGKSATTNRVEHIRNFYDNYTAFRSAIGNNSNFPDDTSGNSKGYQTGSIVTVLGSTSKLYSGYYYDIKGRMTKKVQSNYMGGYETTTSTYTFSGKPSSVSHVHTASGKPTRTEIYSYTYDHADRLTQVGHTLNGTKVTLSANTYDNLGRLSTKSLHGSASNRLTYSYNIRNWLSGISSASFTQNLYYNTGNGTAKYNGNISSMTWQAGSEGVTRGYKFSYDGLNRLLNATYGEGTAISTNANRFSENVTGYDKNGNIKNLQRYGQTSSSAYGLIDNLSYTLTGNQLNRVDDAVTASAYNNGFEFKNGASAANEYAYDANGNLTKDSNKGISNISYNVLNLPSVVTFSDGSTVTYTYSAEGIKLRTVHKTGSATTTTDYCGNVIYENNTAKLLLTEEGYVSLNDNKYHYYLKDHQGNNRVVVNQSGSMEETNHYYPFGGVFASTNIQPYKYNGKELDSKKGLNWYDYGARHYDAALGRWHAVDPMSELYNFTSPYAYCLNNPSLLVDLDGMQVSDSIVNGGIIPEVVIQSTKVLPPVSGVWGNVFNFLFGRTYSSPVYGVSGKGIDTTAPIGTITYNVNKQGYITGVAPIGGIAPLPTIAGKGNNITELLKVASKPSKSGLTAVGRALKKHGDRVGSIFPQARGNQAAINAQGEKVLKDILMDPNVQRTINPTKVGRYGGNVVDYRIPGGKGVRYNANESEFIGFLEP